MIKYYKSLGGIFETDGPEIGGWTNVIIPDTLEIEKLTKEYRVPDELIQDILDTDERPRLEFDDDWTLLILRIPIQITSHRGVPPFITVPLGIYITYEQVITICGSDNEVLPTEQPSLYRGHTKQVKDLTHFILNLFLRAAKIYLKYLKNINHQSTQIEKELELSIRNEELHQLLNMEKSLVYFFTSLRGNELLLTKFKNSRIALLNEANQDLFEDAVIENKQAVDMVQIYSDIQGGRMDTFASVISNNLNFVMKRLTAVSIILMIPTLISSLYGMNVTNYLEKPWWAFPAILSFSALTAITVIYVFRRQKFF